MKKLSLNKITIGLLVVLTEHKDGTVFQIVSIDKFRVGVVPAAGSNHATQYTDVSLLGSPTKEQLANLITQKAEAPIRLNGKRKTQNNMVWIEIQLHPDADVCISRAAAANRMLARIAEVPVNELGHKFSYMPETKKYAFGHIMGHKVLTDNGEWFDLDYMGRA